MASLLLKNFLAYLKPYLSLLIQFPLSVLLYGLEVLAEINFSCPCNVKINLRLALSMFSGPFFFILAVMFFIFRPFKHGWFHCPKTANGATKDEALLKSLGNCLIPPLMWVIILFLDGDYVACGRTDWNGRYVFDEKLNRSWCKPTEEMRNEDELRGLTNYSLHYSRYIGYVLIGILGSVLLVSVGVYDSCVTGKCDWCSICILKRCGRTDSESLRPHDSNILKSNLPQNKCDPKIRSELLMDNMGAGSSHQPDFSESVTGNKQDEGMTKSTGETQTEPKETETFLN